MFSLIITLISIVLVAALALATLYYGEDAFRDGHAAAQASKLRAQGQQLLGAAELFYAQRHAWPTSVAQMVSTGYLSSVPLAQAAMSEALASTPWEMPAAGVPVFVTAGVDAEACRKVNEGTYGLPGVLTEIRPGYAHQCYGATTSQLKVVATRGVTELQRAAQDGNGSIAPEDISSDPIPNGSDEEAWLIPPFESTTPGEPTDPESPPTEPEEPAPEEPPPPPTPAALSVTPSVLTFVEQATNTTEALVVTIQNTGEESATFSGAPAVSGHLAYSIAETNCGAVLTGGASCTVTVNYAPTAVGVGQNGVLTLTPETLDPVVVTLEGSAYNPVSLSASTVPAATRKRTYTPFSFNTFLQVTNESTPELSAVTWQMTGAPPAGLTFNAATGTLSGTPTTVTTGPGTLVSVRATYKGNQALRSYRIVVAGEYLTVTRITAGSGHTCAILPNTTVKCWGQGTSGQLGNGQSVNQQAPVTVTGLSNVTHISAGGAHTCARTSGGAAYCWGLGTSGQLGNSASGNSATPVVVSGLSSGVANISAGAAHTCATLTSGAARCWGRGTEGQLGNAANTNRNAPVAVSGLTTVSAISAGSYFSCAVLTNATGRCWGLNTAGVLGNNSTTNTNAPVTVSLSGIAQISAGNQHTCARTTGGAAYCWGDGQWGLLGTGNTTSRSVPTLVSGLTAGVTHISAGYHTCAIVSGQPRCWGPGEDGELGNNSPTNQMTPVAVSNIGSVSDIDTGSDHTCGVAASGQAQCWGWGAYGALGADATTRAYVPTPVFSD